MSYKIGTHFLWIVHGEMHSNNKEREKRHNTDIVNNITLSSTCYKIGTHSL